MSLNGVGKAALGTPSGAVNTDVSTGGASAGGGYLTTDKDAKESSTDAKFGEVWKQIQSKYGAKPEKPREIKKTLGKDDFLRIMVTQMKNQDPTSPFKAEQFATEMAQFTSVEQLQNLNQGMSKLANANQPLERLAMTNLIGKTVTVDRERFPHIEGQGDALNFVLPKDAAQVHVAVISDAGDMIFDKDLGPMKSGENTFSWDGIKKNTLPAKSGNYMYHITAVDPAGQGIQTNPKGQTNVIGVSFEGQEPVLLVGNPSRPDKVLLRNVVQIDEGGAGNRIPGAQSLAAAVGAPQSGSNFISYQKGVGSQNADSAQMSPEAQAALKQYESQIQQALNKGSEEGAEGGVGADAEAVRKAAQAKETALRAEYKARPAAQQLAPSGVQKGGMASLSADSVIAMPPRPSAQQQQQQDSSKGFPNGIHEGDERPASQRGGQ